MIEKIEIIEKIIDNYNYNYNYIDEELEKDILEIYRMAEHINITDIIMYIGNFLNNNAIPKQISYKEAEPFVSVIEKIRMHFYDRIENEKLINRAFGTTSWMREEANSNNLSYFYNDVKVINQDVPYIILLLSCVDKCNNRNIKYKSVNKIIECIILRNTICSIYYSIYIVEKEWKVFTDRLSNNTNDYYKNCGSSTLYLINIYLINKVSKNNTKKIICKYKLPDLSDYFCLLNKRNISLENKIYIQHSKQRISLSFDANILKYLNKFKLDSEKLYESYNIFNNCKKIKNSNTVCFF